MPRFEYLASQLADPAKQDWPNRDHRPAGARKAAVLMLLSDEDDPELLFTQRSSSLRHHAGQLSFPGGKQDPTDTDAVHTALREAHEEVGLDPGVVRIIGELPDTHLSVSSFDVTPIVASWDGAEVAVTSPDEVAAVHRWRVSRLADPRSRVTATHPRGYRGPAWHIDGLFLWGFSAILTDALLEIAGWAQPWDKRKTTPVPQRFA